MSEITNEMVYEKLKDNLDEARNVKNDCEKKFKEAEKKFKEAFEECNNYRIYYGIVEEKEEYW
jgi:hypothetical protein